MWNIDHLRSYGTQYERMLSEYAEYVVAARAKLSRESPVHSDDIDNLCQRLSSLSVSRCVLSASVLLHVDCSVRQYCSHRSNKLL